MSIERYIGIGELYGIYLECGGIVTTDSRVAGGLFFALRGATHDANIYAPGALVSGAKFVVVDRGDIVPNQDTDPRYLLVEDTLVALQQLAKWHRQKALTEVIALTGTNGKTTTKELMAAALRTRYKIGYTQGNFNNHIGVPLTLLSFDSTMEVVIVEMGANHIGEIAQLCDLAEPNRVLITNVGMAHLEGFGSFEGVVRAKGEIYDYAERSGAEALVSGDDMVLVEMAKGRNMATRFYKNELKNIGTTDGFLSFMLGNTSFSTHLSGAFNAKNIMAAVAVAGVYGIAMEVAAGACAGYLPQNNRSQVIDTQRNLVIMDAYNANPSSMNEALDNFRLVNHPKRVAILGQMNELGEFSRKEHEKLVAMVSGLALSEVFFVGENYEGVVEGYYKTTEELVLFLEKRALSGAYILVKGSRSNRLESVQAYL